jgi:plastocyanin
MTTAVASVEGDGQSGIVGQILANPLRVAVTEDGQPAAGLTVAWATTAAGGVMTPASVATDANGIASSNWTLGSATGNQTAHASVSGASGSPVTFSATALAGAAAKLAKAGGDGQTGQTGAQLPAPVQARVTDEFDNPVAATDVSWSATGATVSSPVASSNSSGISQVTVTLGGTAGPITIIAESAGLLGSPLTFNATAVTPTPAPTSIGITVSNDFFRSNRNNSASPAVDTLAVGGTATWTWVNTATTSHNVTSTGAPSFISSATQTEPATHSFTFPTAGTYRYYCTVHAASNSTVGMIGRIVVR